MVGPVVVDVGPLTASARNLITQTRARTGAPIVMLSDEYDSNAIRRLKASGVAEHLSKPVGLPTLIEAICGVCREDT